jgi:hypothetical protein
MDSKLSLATSNCGKRKFILEDLLNNLILIPNGFHRKNLQILYGNIISPKADSILIVVCCFSSH